MRLVLEFYDKEQYESDRDNRVRERKREDWELRLKTLGAVTR